MSNQWEVEQKFVVEDMALLRARLLETGFAFHHTETNSDVYFRHPCRDLRATDEAFRLRTLDDSSCLTYKGPRLPGAVKTRPEIELDIVHRDRDRWVDMLQLLGFEALPAVTKQRHVFTPTATGSYAAFSFQVTLDEVSLLGNFSEIELLVTAPNQIDAAAAQVQELATQLGLDTLQPRSYLSLLLAKLGVE